MGTGKNTDKYTNNYYFVLIYNSTFYSWAAFKRWKQKYV